MVLTPRESPAARIMDPESGQRPRTPATAPAGERVVVFIIVSAGSEMLEHTHRFVTEYLKRRFLPNVTQALNVGAYELLSNAANYGSVSAEILLEIAESQTSVAVRVTNESIPARIEMLQQHMKKIRAGAEATFVEEMRRSMAGGVARPMLGLARVAHEAGLALDIDVNDRRVTMSARRTR